MKIVHTADLHIGIESHGPMNSHTGLPRRLEDFLRALQEIGQNRHAIGNAAADQRPRNLRSHPGGWIPGKFCELTFVDIQHTTKANGAGTDIRVGAV